MNYGDLDLIPTDEANALLEGRHYLGAVRFSPEFCLSTRERDAVAVYGPPVAASFKRDLHHPLELARLWQAEGVERYTSEFLSATLRWLRRFAPDVSVVITYADPAAGHEGTVYRVTNFVSISQARATDAWQLPSGKILPASQVYRRLKTKSRERVAKLRPTWKLIEGVPKKLFAYPMGEPISVLLRRSQPKQRTMITEGGGLRNAYYQRRFPTKICPGCRRAFAPARSDARTCSDRCRKRLQRRQVSKRKKGGLIFPEVLNF